MACTLSNKYAKNLSKRTVLLQLIIKNVVTCFFWNTVYRPTLPEERASFYELIDTNHTTQKTELINKTSRLAEVSFIVRMLYKDIY